MATSIPPHNLGEVIDGIGGQRSDRRPRDQYRGVDGDPPAASRDRTSHGQGHGRLGDRLSRAAVGLDPIRAYFKTGRGSIKQRGRVGVEQLKGNREQIVITEIPYMVNRATMVEKIASLANDKTITDISAVRDESDENTRVVVELKRDAVPKVVINKLYKFTQLATSFSVNMLAIDHGRPKTMNLKELINAYIEHRREVVLRRTRFELDKAEARAETPRGTLCALANLDEFIRIIRNSKTATKHASSCSRLSFRRRFSRNGASRFANRNASRVATTCSARPR